MLNKEEKQIIVECTKDLYKLLVDHVATESKLGEKLIKITEKLESLLDD